MAENSEDRMVELVREERALLIAEVIDFLTRGALFGPSFGPRHRIRDEAAETLRDFRRQLCERDLYELLYGPLPANAVNPYFTGEPDWDAALDRDPNG